MPASRPILLRLLPAAVIAVVAVAGAIWFRDMLTFETLRDRRAELLALRDAHYPITVLGFMAAYTALVAFSLPGATLSTLTGGFLFGVFPGVLFNVVSATAGATLLFIAVRYGPGEAVARRLDAAHGAVGALKRGMDRNQVPVLLLMRLVPAVPFFVANLTAAMLGVPLGRFVATTFFGIMPGALVYTSVGSGLSGVFARDETPDPGVIFEWQILLPILGLCALAALPMVLRAVRKPE